MMMIIMIIILFIIIWHFLYPLREIRVAFTWIRLLQPQKQRYPFLTVRAVFPCVRTKVWLPMLGVFNVRTVLLMHAIAHGG